LEIELWRPGGWGGSVLIPLIESITWKLSFGGLEARQASAFIFLMKALLGN
jgi:hypothetical protein